MVGAEDELKQGYADKKLIQIDLNVNHNVPPLQIIGLPITGKYRDPESDQYYRNTNVSNFLSMSSSMCMASDHRPN